MGNCTSSDDARLEQDRGTLTKLPLSHDTGSKVNVSAGVPVTEISMTDPFVTLSSSLRRLTSKSVHESRTHSALLQTLSIIRTNGRTSEAGVRIGGANFVYLHRAAREDR